MILSFRRRRLSSWPLTGLVLLAAACPHGLGCGSPDGLVPVAGVVHLDGAPMSGGKILFTPVEQGKPAAGPIQTDGSFVLSSYSLNDGAKPGKHRLMIMTYASKRADRAPAQAEAPRTRTAWVPPQDYIIEIEANKQNQLQIDVSTASGWQQVVND